MSSPQSSPLSPLAECVVLTTIHRWCITYRRSYSMTTYNETTSPSRCSSDTNTGCACKDADRVGEGGCDDFWARQRWLASAIEKRLQSLGAHNSRVSSTVHDVGGDPMLLFAWMLAHSAAIRLGNVARRRAAAPSRFAEQLHSAANFEYEASSAAAEMVHLAGQMPSFGYFKVHPFLPDPVGCAATYLTYRSGGNVSLCSDGGGGSQQEQEISHCVRIEQLLRKISEIGCQLFVLSLELRVASNKWFRSKCVYSGRYMRCVCGPFIQW